MILESVYEKGCVQMNRCIRVVVVVVVQRVVAKFLPGTCTTFKIASAMVGRKLKV